MAIATSAFRYGFEDKSTLNNLNDIFKKKRGYSVRMPPAGALVILIVSGGFDSIILWEILMKKYQYKVWPIHFRGDIKGQERSLKFFSQYFQKKYPDRFNKVYENPIDKKIFYTASLKKSVVFNDLPFMVNNLNYSKLSNRYGISLVAAPTRQFYFILMGYEYRIRLLLEKGIVIDTIYTGIVPDDAKISRESTLALIRSVNLSFSLLFGDFQLQCLSGLEKEIGFFFWKKDLLDFAIKTGLPVEKTWSCEKNRRYHCGRCSSCRSRAYVFKQAGVKDKTVYRVDLIDRLKEYFKKSSLFDFYNVLKHKIAYKPSKKKVKVNASSLISVNKMVDWYEKEKDVFLFHKKYGDLEALNKVGSRVWRIIVKYKNITFGEIVDIMVKDYKIKKITLEPDIKKFIKSLAQKEYVDIEN